MHVLFIYIWHSRNYGLDVLNITMHTEVVIHSMNAYVWCWSKICAEVQNRKQRKCKSENYIL